MARYYFPGSEIIVSPGGGTPAALTLAPNAAFTVWSQESGGSQYTDLKAEDGTTDLPTSGGAPFADLNGKPPGLWGPDGVKGPMWRDTGTGRYPMYPSTEMGLILANGARINVAQTFTAAQSFSGAVAFTTAPTISGSAVVSAATFEDLYVALFIEFGQPLTLYWDGTSWPSLDTVHPAYIASGKFIVWNSETDSAAPEPPITSREDDFWDKLL